jgi:hypothetical protein
LRDKATPELVSVTNSGSVHTSTVKGFRSHSGATYSHSHSQEEPERQ